MVRDGQCVGRAFLCVVLSHNQTSSVVAELRRSECVEPPVADLPLRDFEWRGFGKTGVRTTLITADTADQSR